jgi:hypothetical protein
MISSELIARVAAMKKRPSPDKLAALEHAVHYNSITDFDRVCLYRGCYHHQSEHGKSWKLPNGKRRTCRCKHQRYF